MQDHGKSVSETTRWHRLLGKLLELLLAPTGISVDMEVQIMGDPPRADIVLLRRNEPEWTPEQIRLLPDGIRDTNASHIMIEFKRTESINVEILLKIAAYDLLYRQSRKLNPDEVSTFLISARKPRTETLQRLGFTPTGEAGIYETDNILAKRVRLISLNELDSEPFNAFLKLFATHAKVRGEAFVALRKAGIFAPANELSWYVGGLWNQLAPDEGVSPMSTELTPEYIMKIGREWGEAYLKMLPIETRLAGLRPEERLAGLRPEERLAGLRPEEYLAGLRPEQLVAALSEEDLKALEAHLQARKQNKDATNDDAS